MRQSTGTGCQISSVCQLAAELQLLETPLDRVCQVPGIKFPREKALMMVQIYFKPFRYDLTTPRILNFHGCGALFASSWQTPRPGERGCARAVPDVGQSSAFHSSHLPKTQLARLMGREQPERLPSVFSLCNFARVLGTCQIRSCLLSLLDWLCQKRK